MKFSLKWEKRPYPYCKGKISLYCDYELNGGWVMVDIPILPKSTLSARKEEAENIVRRSFNLALLMIGKDLYHLEITQLDGK